MKVLHVIDTLAVVGRAAAREHLGADSDAPVVLFVGALSEQKRPERFLRVLARVRERVTDVRGEGLADAVARVLTDRELRDRLGAAAREPVDERFTIASATESHLAFFTELVGSRNGRHRDE